jgi:hypothetical protein
VSRPGRLDYHAAVASLDRIAGYKIKDLLGSAGPTDTYRGRGIRAGAKRSVAIKLLRLERLPENVRELAGERFLDAGQRAGAATVGGMSPVIEIGQAPAGPFVVSELVPGLDLRHLLRLARKHQPDAPGLEPSLARALCAQVARILTSAHESTPPLPHLGLRPSTIRVTPTAGVMLVDFGMGAALRGLGSQSVSDWYFLAPELLSTDVSGGWDGSPEAADLYSLGAVLHFLLTGRPPAEAETLAQLALQAWEPLPDLPGVPQDLVDITRRLTAPEPEKRPASIREAADLLADAAITAQERRQRIASALRTLGVEARPRKDLGDERPDGGEASAAAGKAASPSPPAARRSRWGLWLALLTVLGGVAAGWFLLSSRRAPAPLPSPSEELAANPEEQARVPLNTQEIPPPGPVQAGAGMDASAPLDRVYRPIPKRTLPRVPNHLNLDTTPSGADVWVDGVLRGKTPVDLVIGPGGHRVVVLKDGFRMKKDVYDTTNGEWIRINLQPSNYPRTGQTYLNVYCRGTNRYPVFVDEEDTGHLCPARMVPVGPGRRKVAVFVPNRRGFATSEVDVSVSPRPLPVTVPD